MMNSFLPIRDESGEEVDMCVGKVLLQSLRVAGGTVESDEKTLVRFPKSEPALDAADGVLQCV